MNIYFLTFFGIFFSYYFLKSSIPFLKVFLIDKPNERSSHIKPTPTSGGITFVFLGSLLTLINGNFIPLLCIPLGIIGLIDDLFKLPNLMRYISQLVTVIILFCLFVSKNLYLMDISSFNFFIFSFFIIFFGTAIINFSNFMDGIDGLVAGSFVVIIASSAFINDISILPLAGCLIGFTLLNWNPAKVFMGDSGSTFLGAILCGLIFSSKDFISALSLIMISTPLLIDSAFCIIRRLMKNQNIFKAHKSHLYQRLNQAGWGHNKVSTIYIFNIIFLSLSYFIFGFKFLILCSCFTILTGIYLDYFIAVPFRVNE